MVEYIDRYQIIKSVNKGGMGEIFLVYDPLCKREVALKQILPKFKKHPVIQARFLREAEVAAMLNHPSIIPVFSIDSSAEKSYYTMPYIAGDTLKQILKRCLEEEQTTRAVETSIPTLMRIFLKLCEAVNYAHAHKIVHRDLKPDNVLIGKYGEVLIFDWGLSDFEGSLCQEEDIPEERTNLTRPGKVPGTLNYIAPERLQGVATTAQMDVYSLGVILYQLLTLRSPFQRHSMPEFKKNVALEELISPLERAPYRHIPEPLSALTLSCLAPDPKQRMHSVQGIIDTLKIFLDGQPKWIKTLQLDPHHPEPWEFRENVLIAKHLAITGSPEVMRWAHVMISKHNLMGNFRIDVHFQLKHTSEGISLLIGVPPREERTHFLEGIQLAIGKTSHLLYNGAMLMTLPGGAIEDEQPHHLCIEHSQAQLTLMLDDKRIGQYILRTPLPGNQIGIIAYDADFILEPLILRERGQSALVSCLNIPDAFLSHKDFKKARIEYRKIAESFPGSHESKEALFREGICALEEWKMADTQPEKEHCLLLALAAFDLLHNTSAAPLEYVGKSLVYKHSDEVEEEAKCLELALRKYHKHPMRQAVQEQLLLRLYESSSSSRRSAYLFALLALTQLLSPPLLDTHNALFTSLDTHLEAHPLLLSHEPKQEALACKFALWLGKITTLIELSEIPSSPVALDASYSLLLLGHKESVEENLSAFADAHELLTIAINYFITGPATALEQLFRYPPCCERDRCLAFLIQRSVWDGHTRTLLPFLSQFPLTPYFDAQRLIIWLTENHIDPAKELLSAYAPEQLSHPTSPLFFPQALFLLKTKQHKAALNHLSAAPLSSPSSLLPQYLHKSPQEQEHWIHKELLYLEQLALLQQLQFYPPSKEIAHTISTLQILTQL